jgi:hypothetical protein
MSLTIGANSQRERGWRMKASARLLVVMLLWAMPSARAFGQHLFLDSNGDGYATEADKLSENGITSLDIWIETDRNRDGTSTDAAGDVPSSIFSYSVALRAIGGTISWGRYENHQTIMNVPFGRSESVTEFYVAYAGTKMLPPGKYRLGTLEMRTLTGHPDLSFAAATSIPGGVTSFGSARPGRDQDNTLKLSGDGGAGDWSDADGIGARGSSIILQGERADRDQQFGARLSREGENASIQLRVTTTKPGFLRVRLFDVAGRLVRVLFDTPSAPAGTIALEPKDRELASGIYFYRVEAAEGRVQGRITMLR